MGNCCRKCCSCCFPCCCCCKTEEKTSSYVVHGDTVLVNKPTAPGTNTAPETKRTNKPPPSPNGQKDVYVALYDYQAGTNEELSFSAGDHLQILDFTHQSWWRARALAPRGKPEGYIPFNYVAHISSLNSKPWFFSNTKRSEAERQLCLPGNQAGSFLIRESESQKGDYSLSVYDGAAVKHYRIRKLDNGGFFISPRSKFKDLVELVQHYKRSPDGLCGKLTSPCKKTEIPLPPDLCYQLADHWEIDRNSLKFLKKLGQGQFGEVWEGLWNNTISVAIKTLKAGSMNPEDFFREAQLMKRLRHPRLIQLYAVCSLEEPMYIITELMKHGSLLSYLQSDNGATIKVPQQIDMAAQVASGMAYLETQNFIHRDLAARNVLVGENSVYKVADFGLARVFEDEVYEPRNNLRLPVKWTAPEAIRLNKFTVKSDVWSFGILLFEIVTYGTMPYQGWNGRQTLDKLEQGYRIPKPFNCPQDLYTIMLDCWNTNPENRPTFETLQWRLEDYFDTDSSAYLDGNTFVN